MSDSDEDANIPSSDVCEQRCQEFAHITGTDTALAMCLLQDRDWDLQRALNAFFESPAGLSAANPGSSSTTQTGKPPDVKPKCVIPVDPEPHRIRLLSWNIDGIDQNSMGNCTKGVCSTITKEKPDVVFLQEVVRTTQQVIEDCLPQYQLIASGEDAYYTAMLLRCDTVVYSDHAITPFYTSKMGRNILQVKARVKDVDMILMTSHLESTKQHTTERKRQLQTCFKTVKESPGEKTVVFGGDLNLRDDEIAALGGVPEGLYDIWEVTGKRPEAKFTWDCMRNDNLEMNGKFKPRARFDRLYMRHSKPKSSLKPVYFELVGIERLQSCQRFCSDHWGLLTHYDKV